jgi:alpha-ketoglutarate-dependent taurine dioxygenase
VQVTSFADGLGAAYTASASTDLLALRRDDVIEAFLRTGLVFFEGFELDQERFRAFTTQFAAAFVTEYNPLERHYLGDGTMTVQYYAEGIPLHGEMAYLPRINPQLGPPDIMWFYCERPAREGGETLVCDGARVVEALSAGTRALLERKRLKYRLVTSPPVWQAAAGTADRAMVQTMLQHVPGVVHVEFDADGTMRWDFATPAIKPARFTKICIRPPFEDGEPIPDEVIREIEDVTERLTVPVRWKGGELLMIDNTRYLHGRRSNDDQRRVYVRMGTAAF